VPKRRVDFGDVDPEIRSGKRSKRVPEGDYLLKIMEGSWEEGEKADYIRWRFQITTGKHKGGTLYANTSLSKKALWNLRNLIFAAKGRNVAGKAVNFDPESLHGDIVGAAVEDNEWDGKINSVPVNFFPKDNFEAQDEDEDDEDSDDEEEEVEDEEDEDTALDEVDVEEL
jgi:hypothetical protein